MIVPLTVRSRLTVSVTPAFCVTFAPKSTTRSFTVEVAVTVGWFVVTGTRTKLTPDGTPFGFQFAASDQSVLTAPVHRIGGGPATTARHAENSDVPSVEVAVAVMNDPADLGREVER